MEASVSPSLRHGRPQRVEHPAQLRQLGLVDLDQRQAHAAQLEAELAERGLDRRGRRRDEERAVEVLAARRRAPARARCRRRCAASKTSFMRSPARCDETVMPPAPPISANGRSRLSSPASSASSESSTIRRAASMSAFACLTPDDVVDLRQLDQQVRLEVDHGPARDVVEQHRHVARGLRARFEVRSQARARSACCSRASRPARRPRRAPPPARVRRTECAVSLEPGARDHRGARRRARPRRPRTGAASPRRRGSRTRRSCRRSRRRRSRARPDGASGRARRPR